MVSKSNFLDGFAVAGATCRYIAASLLLVIAPGCCQRSHEADTSSNVGSEALSHRVRTFSAAKQTQTDAMEKKLMSVWRSPKSTPQERAEALNKWLSPETSIESAISLLGDNGLLSRDHGPSTVFSSGKNGVVAHQGGYYEKFWLEYKMPGGSVSLSFDNQGGASREWRFEHAYVPGQITTPKTNWGQ
jgi:hypothetical protein